jgi:hypothetical protein
MLKRYAKAASHYICAMLRRILVILALLSGSVQAQVVNVEAMRGLTGSEPGTHGVLDGSFYFGGTQALLLRLSTSANFRKTLGKESYYAIFNGNLSTRVGGDALLFEQNGFVHGRYNVEWTDEWTGEVFFQWQSNKPMRIAQRFNFGAGPRFRAIDSKTVNFFLSPLVMYELDIESVTGVYESVARMSTYMSLDVLLKEKYRLNTIAYYQPQVLQWDDVRVVINSRFSTPISPKLNLTISGNLNYDAYPAGTDVPNFTYGINSGLSWRF